MRWLAVCLLATACHRGVTDGDDYPASPPAPAIAAGDVLDVAIWQHGDLGAITVAADGTVAIDGVGTVPASGRSTVQLAAAIRERLPDHALVRVLVAEAK